MKHPQYYLSGAIAEAGEHNLVRFRNDYSGRGMYGKTCVGITGPRYDCQSMIAEAISSAIIDWQMVPLGSSREETDLFYRELVNTLNSYRTDSMGLDVILYWPELPPIPGDLL